MAFEKNNINSQEKLTPSIFLEDGKLKVSKDLLVETLSWCNDFSARGKGFYDLGSSINAYLYGIEEGRGFSKNGSNLPAHILEAVREEGKNDDKSDFSRNFHNFILEVIKEDKDKIVDFFIETNSGIEYINMINRDDAQRIKNFFHNTKNLKLIHLSVDSLEFYESSEEYRNDNDFHLMLDYLRKEQNERRNALRENTFDQYNKKYDGEDLKYLQDAQYVLSSLIRGYRELINKNK